MRVLIQRVSKATVEVDGEIISKINRGLLLFVGVTHEDDRGIADHLARKSAQLRIFEDDQQRQHQCSALDLNLEALVVSQFTLYGNTSKAGDPDLTRAPLLKKRNGFTMPSLNRLRTQDFDALPENFVRR